MAVSVNNAQRTVPVNVARMARVARCAVHRLGIRARGRLDITFVDAGRMRMLNRQFCRRDVDTDVLSFRYDGESVVGDILVCPSAARQYARQHRVAYTEELARYVVHGLLHWVGYKDRTMEQQRLMRIMEGQILARCMNRPVGTDKWDISIFSSRKAKEKTETSRRA